MAPTPAFVPEKLLKSDLMGTVEAGLIEGRRAVRRSFRAAPIWVRPIAWILAGRERRALQRLSGVDRVPELLAFGGGVLVRSYLDGTTLDAAAPRGAAYYADARRLLRSIHRRGVTHNDTHKEENWLVVPDGCAALVDFQLAGVHRRRGAWFRLCRSEDFRHLLKHKRTHCAASLTARERRLLATKSWPALWWARTVKPVYGFVTRKLLRWRDREGKG
jgi:hypothetical protein